MTLIIAHRGFSGKYPENTLLAVRKAVQLGVDWVEVDARLSRDNALILMHDKKLNRTTNGEGYVSRKSLKEIRRLKIKDRNLTVPVIEEVFDVIKKSKTRLNIEVKTLWPALQLIKLIREYKLYDQVMISSGSITALKVVKLELPTLKTALIFFNSNHPKWDYFATSIAKLSFELTNRLILFVAKSARVDNVHISYPFATNGFIKRLHKRGYKVNVWTVNTRALMRKLIKNGVDGIITNRPDLLKAVLRKKPKSKKPVPKPRP